MSNINLPEGARVFEFDSEKQYIIYVPHGTDIQAMIRNGGGMGIRAQIIAVEDPSQIKVKEVQPKQYHG